MIGVFFVISLLITLFFLAIIGVTFYFSLRNFKHLMAFKILGIIFGLILVPVAIGLMINTAHALTHTGDYSPEAIRSSKASESRESAKESRKEASSKASESESDAESSSISKAQESIKSDEIDELNHEFENNPSLSGLHVEKDPYGNGDDYDVTVPDELAAADSNEQKEDYRNLVTIIRKKTGVQNPTVFFMDSGHNTVAETTWSGDIKLHK